jgi:hypothetical protein
MLDQIDGEANAADALARSVASLASTPPTSGPPNEYLCPITGELMEDPVVIKSGHTFERAAIEQWFATGRHTCPTTNATVTADLVPSTQLRILIREYREQHGV